jgi:thiol:disulfide interchange protein
VKTFETPVNSIPLTLIGDEKIVGYSSDATQGKQIDEAIQYCLTNTCADLVLPILELQSKKDAEKQIVADVKKIEGTAGEASTQVSVPFFGTVQLADFSLPIVTIILGTLDGFNPCAMWILIFLISMLIGMQDRRKMWIIGFAFIFVSALSYFLFITAWLQVMIFIGFIASIRAAIGVFALAGGSWNIYTYWKTRDSGCEIVSTKKRKKISQQIRDIIHEKNMIIALV